MSKVLHVIAGVSVASGGPTSALRAILQMLQGTEVRSSVVVGVTDPADGKVLAEIGGAAAELTAFPREFFSRFSCSLAYTRRLRRIVRNHDLVHIHSMWNWPTFWAARVAKQEGVPVVFRPAGALDQFDVRKHRRMKTLLGPVFLRRLFEAPNVFHCTARREAEQLVTYGGQARRELLPLPVLGLRPEADAGAELRRRLGIPAEAPVVGFLSRLNYKKGLELLLPALARARVRFSGLHFLLAGAGEAEIETMVSDLIATHGLADCTHRLGFVEGAEKAAVLAASDVFALPSQNENFGMSVIEALSAGRPVLVSPEVYITGEIGPSPALVVSARSVEAITRDLEVLLARVRSGRGELEVEARALWATNFAPEILRPRYLDFYRRVIRQAQIQ